MYGRLHGRHLLHPVVRIVGRPERTVRSIEGQAIDTESRPETKNLSALMEAGDRKQLTCTSMQPLSAQRALNDIVFSCPEFDVQATLIEMRDAGWRLISVDIGSETSHDGVVEMPLTIQIIKLF